MAIQLDSKTETRIADLQTVMSKVGIDDTQYTVVRTEKGGVHALIDLGTFQARIQPYTERSTGNKLVRLLDGAIAGRELMSIGCVKGVDYGAVLLSYIGALQASGYAGYKAPRPVLKRADKAPLA